MPQRGKRARATPLGAGTTRAPGERRRTRWTGAEARRLALVGGAAAVGAPLAGLVLSRRARSRAGSLLLAVAALLGAVATVAMVGTTSGG